MHLLDSWVRGCFPFLHPVSWPSIQCQSHSIRVCGSTLAIGVNLWHPFPGCIMWDCIVGEGFWGWGYSNPEERSWPPAEFPPQPLPLFSLECIPSCRASSQVSIKVRICGGGGGSDCALQFILLLLFLKGARRGSQLPQHKMDFCCIPHQAPLPAGPQFPHL